MNAGEIQQVCTQLCMIRHLRRKYLTVQPEQVHIRPASSAQRCVSMRLYQDQLLQINNSASSLSRGTLGETGRWRTNHIRGPLKLYMASGKAIPLLWG